MADSSDMTNLPGLDGQPEDTTQIAAQYARDIDIQLASAKLSVGTSQTFQPAVLIGLGGSGIYSVRRAKQLLQDRLGKLPPLFRFLYIDADTVAFANAPGLAPVEVNEQCCIGGPDAIMPVVKDQGAHRWLLDQMPKELKPAHYEKVAKGQGCGQIRAVGRLALLASLQGLVEQKFQRAKDDVTALASGLLSELTHSGSAPAGLNIDSGVTVYVVGSLAGGTGSGTFIDVGLLARRYCSQLVAILMLPEAFDEKQPNQAERQVIRANAYAALKELQALQDAQTDVALKVVTSSSGDALELPPQTELFDLCYLVDCRNKSGKRLSKLTDVFELVARLLVHENGTPFGGRNRSVVINSGIRRKTDVCKKTGLAREFSTFSNTILRFPIERVVRYCVWATLQELIQSGLLKAPLSPSECEGQAAGYLGNNGLNELGPNANQIQDQLLKDPAKGVPLDSSIEGVASGFGAAMSAKEFADALKTKRDNFENRTLAKVQNIVAGNIVTYIGGGKGKERPLEAVFDTVLAACVNQNGVRGAVSVWSELKSRIEMMKKEMEAEVEAWRKGGGRKSYQDQLATALDQLDRMSKAEEWATKHDAQCKSRAISSFRAIADGDIRERVRSGAGAVLDVALAAVVERGGRLDRFESEAALLSRELRDNLNALRAEGARAIGDFVLEMDVTDAAYLDVYFKANRIEPTAALADVQGTFKSQATGKGEDGNAAAFFAWLLGLGRKGIFDAFSAPIRERYRTKVLSTNVVDFVMGPGREKAVVTTKLNELFGMCEPFWKVSEPISGTTYAQITALGCTPVQSGQTFEFPPVVTEWINRFARGDAAQPGIEATNAPYEVELVRYTHGARAMYLDDAKDWKTKYDALTKQGAFPLHIDRRFVDLPDLDVTADDYKAAADGRRAFALGMALGFVAKRGQQYFMNVEANAAKAAAGIATYHVPYMTEWHTVFEPADDYQPPDPTACTSVSFELKKAVPPKKLLLAEGREQACRAIEKAPDRAKVIWAALSAYITEASSVSASSAKQQLGVYGQFLESYDAPPDTRNQVDAERALIESYAKALE